MPGVVRLARKFIIGKTLADDLLCHGAETVAVFPLALVESESLLVKVTEQVKRLD